MDQAAPKSFRSLFFPFKDQPHTCSKQPSTPELGLKTLTHHDSNHAFHRSLNPNILSFSSSGKEKDGNDRREQEEEANGDQDQEQEQGDNGGFCSWSGKSKQYRQFPPPMPSLARTGNLHCHTPWVLKRSYKNDGRLVIQEFKVPHHEFFRARRANGRLTLRLVWLEEPRDDSQESEKPNDSFMIIDDEKQPLTPPPPPVADNNGIVLGSDQDKNHALPVPSSLLPSQRILSNDGMHDHSHGDSPPPPPPLVADNNGIVLGSDQDKNHALPVPSSLLPSQRILSNDGMHDHSHGDYRLSSSTSMVLSSLPESSLGGINGGGCYAGRRLSSLFQMPVPIQS